MNKDKSDKTEKVIGLYSYRRNLIEAHLPATEVTSWAGIQVRQQGKVVKTKAQPRANQRSIVDIELLEMVQEGPVEVVITPDVLNEHKRPIFNEAIAFGIYKSP